MTKAPVDEIQQALVATAGGFLRNLGGPDRCERCFCPTASGAKCFACRTAESIPGAPDLLGFMTYAGYIDPIAQSGHVMRGYKFAGGPIGTHLQTVQLMSGLALAGHVACPGRILGTPVTAWATVPSLPPKPGQPDHALNKIVRKLARSGATEVVLQASTSVRNPRAVSADHFSVAEGSPLEEHVLLVDDTWTSGGHATSAALALRAAGASRVSVLALARWLSIGWEATTAAWARKHLTAPDFRSDVCPWTQGDCP